MSRSWSIRAICVVCAAMLCLVGAEVQWSLETETPPSLGLTRHTLQRQRRQALVVWQTATSDKLVATIVRRPMFSRSRRPAVATQDASASQREDGLPKLSGIIHAPDVRRAIFQSQGPLKPIVWDIGEGQIINGWTVKHIEPGSVTLIHDGRTVLLTPTFGTITVQPPVQQKPISRWLAPAPSGILRARWSNPQLQP